MPNMEDIGTRMDHITDLRDTWRAVVARIAKQTWSTAKERETLAELRIGINLLNDFLTEDLRPWTYGTLINAIPTADKITGGRGTPLATPLTPQENQNAGTRQENQSS